MGEDFVARLVSEVLVEGGCLGLGDDFYELGESDDDVGPVAVVHARLDVRWLVDHAEEFDFVAVLAHDLAQFKCDGAAVRVSGNGVWTLWLYLFDLGVVIRYAICHALEERFSVKPSGSKSIDRSIGDILGETEKDEHLANTGMY